MSTAWRWTILLAIGMWAGTGASAAPAIVLVVRHAEKAALPADDPVLSPAGALRAGELARVVQAWTSAGVPLRGLFSSEKKRTQQTLEPLAALTGSKVSVVGGTETGALVKRILAVEGGIVVVAGHSNTMPDLIQALGGPAGIAIDDADYDRLFAITLAGSKAQVVELRYGAQR